MARARLSLSARIERDALTGRATLDFGRDQIDLELAVPSGPTDFEDLLPILQGLTDFLVERAAEGRRISCRAGCGACCRQLVPVSQAEARALAGLVDAMPEPRQRAVRDRFHAAMLAFQASGLLADIDAARKGETPLMDNLGPRYFAQRVPCPFLEAESCSIHADRPLICREYLVTSPAELCRHPAPDVIQRVDVRSSPARALLLADSAASGRPWMPLIYALGFAATVPADAASRSAPELLAELFALLKGNGT